MADLIIQELDEDVCEQLKRRAEANHRSLEAEVCSILERAIQEKTLDMTTVRARADAIRLKLEGRPHSDSSVLIREDRSGTPSD